MGNAIINKIKEQCNLDNCIFVLIKFELIDLLELLTHCIFRIRMFPFFNEHLFCPLSSCQKCLKSHNSSASSMFAGLLAHAANSSTDRCAFVARFVVPMAAKWLPIVAFLGPFTIAPPGKATLQHNEPDCRLDSGKGYECVT